MEIKEKKAKISWLRVFSIIIIWAWFIYVFLPSKYTYQENETKDIIFENAIIERYNKNGKKVAVITSKKVNANELTKRSLYHNVKCIAGNKDKKTTITSDFALEKRKSKEITFYQNVILIQPNKTIMKTDKAIYDIYGNKVICPNTVIMNEKSMRTIVSNIMIYLKLNLAKSKNRVRILFDKVGNKK